MSKQKNISLKSSKSAEELLKYKFDMELKEAENTITLLGQPKTERKKFSVGERVVSPMSGLISCYITEIISEGIYKTKYKYITTKPYSSEKIEVENESIYTWVDLFKYNPENTTLIELKKRGKFQFMQQKIHSLLLYFKLTGIYDTPLYQRDYVWSKEDKHKLIDSIFNQIEIGKFVLIQLDESINNCYYEVLDGKQRLNALLEFYTDMFQYKGRYYSELSTLEKSYFQSFSVSVATVENISESEKIDYFISLNTCGKVMSEEHLNNIKIKYGK